jgi:thiamine biosynthesis lipoprotein
MPREMIQHQRPLMGTLVGVTLAVDIDDIAVARMAAEACLDWMAEVDARLSRFHTTSEISALNRAAGQWFVASPMLFAVTQAALDAAWATDGLFDPTLLPQLVALGYDRDYRQIAQREAHKAWRVPRNAERVGQWRDIVLDPDGRRIRLPADAQLDVGGIAKGWAADEALARFFEPFPNVLIDVGGDLRVRGRVQEEERWAIGMQNPRAVTAPDLAAHVAVLTLGEGGVATSGATHCWWLRAGERQHHLLDPRTNRPVPLWIDAMDDVPSPGAPLLATATALAPTATWAEVAAKVALLQGYPRALGLVEEAWKTRQSPPTAEVAPLPTGTEVALLLILGSGEVAYSTNLDEFLATCAKGGSLWMLA